MDYLLGVSTRGGWEDWIKFCLEGVVSNPKMQKKDATSSLNCNLNFMHVLRTEAFVCPNLLTVFFPVQL